MKRILSAIISVLFYFPSYSQETLQSATDRGMSTNRAIYSKGMSVVGSGFGRIAYLQYDPNINKAAIGGFTYDGNQGVDLLINQYGGNVGIGTTSPESRLHVDGSGTWGLTNATNLWVDVNQVQARYNGSGSPLYLNYTNGGNIITGRGNVGIGTTNPQSRLHVDGSGTLGLTNTTNLWLDINQVQARYNGSGSSLYLNYTNGGNIITGSGNVGIGTTTPTEKLSVKGKIRAQEIKSRDFQLA